MDADQPTVDPLLKVPATVRFVQPYQAGKAYQCPRCDQIIPVRTGHYVVVPVDAADLRRHWHKHCWLHQLEHGFKR